MTGSARIRALWLIIESHAPSQTALDQVRKLIGAMQDDQLDAHEQEKQLAGILYDGLYAGNWPWNMPGPEVTG